MKVSFVTPAYYPAVIGASFYCQSLATELAKHGIKVAVYTNAPTNLRKEEVVDGISVRRFYPRVFGNYYVSQGMLSAVKKDDSDIIHSHHYGYYPATAGLIAAKLGKKPHVFGPYYHPPIYGMKRWLLSSVYHATQGLPLIRFSDKVLPHTEYEKKALINAGGIEEKMELLPNVVDTKKFRHSKKKEKIVLFVGNLLSEKGADVAMRLAEEIDGQRKDTKFVFIGYNVQKDLHTKIEELKKKKNFLFLSGLSLRELIKWYQKSLVFILPSRYEAFAKVIAEAESCGAAIVSTKVGGIPEVVENKKTGYLVDYGNWDEMKERINYLLDNPSRAKSMGVEGSKFVRKNFETSIIVKKLVKIYDDIL